MRSWGGVGWWQTYLRVEGLETVGPERERRLVSKAVSEAFWKPWLRRRKLTFGMQGFLALWLQLEKDLGSNKSE